MKSTSNESTVLGELGSAIGKGLIAGFAGTMAITVSQLIEMRITTLHIEASPGNKEEFSNEVHWVYGTSWGVMRGLLSMAGITGFAATTLHMASVWGTAVTIQPKLDIAPPLSEWELKDIAIDLLHHAVYAIVAGLVYDAID